MRQFTTNNALLFIGVMNLCVNGNFKMGSAKETANIYFIAKIIILCIPQNSDTDNYYNLINDNL